MRNYKIKCVHIISETLNSIKNINIIIYYYYTL